MQERAREDRFTGAFTLNVQHLGKPYLVRVFHQGVSYDQQASRQALYRSVRRSDTCAGQVTGTIEISPAPEPLETCSRFRHGRD